MPAGQLRWVLIYANRGGLRTAVKPTAVNSAKTEVAEDASPVRSKRFCYGAEMSNLGGHLSKFRVSAKC